jgi:hypothetical protein
MVTGVPGRKSYMGKLSEFQRSICLGLMSTTVTLTCGHLKAMTAMVGPPTYPAPKQQIFTLNSLILYDLCIIAWMRRGHACTNGYRWGVLTMGIGRIGWDGGGCWECKEIVSANVREKVYSFGQRFGRSSSETWIERYAWREIQRDMHAWREIQRDMHAWIQRDMHGERYMHGER